MEEDRKSSESAQRIRKSSAFKVPFDPLECWNACRKDRSRQCSSVSKVKTRLSNLAMQTSPIDDDKTLQQIQKKLDALSSVQNSINQDLKLFIKSPVSISPPRQLSARRVRKGVIYKLSEKFMHNIIEIRNQVICPKCKTSWIAKNEKKNCDMCVSNTSGLAFDVELKILEDPSKALLIIGEKEIPVNLNNRFKCVISFLPGSKKEPEKNKTFDVDSAVEWNEFTRVATPSFHLNTERILESTKISDNSSNIFQGDMSFSEHSKPFTSIITELDNLSARQFTVLESPSLSKIKEVCDSITNDYTKILKKLLSHTYSELAFALEKCYKGLTLFSNSCIISLIKYISQLQDRNSLAKDAEQKYEVRIASLTKLLQKYQDGAQQKRPIHRY